MKRPILAVDFDGVINSYTSGWKGPWKILDDPMPGAIEWLKKLAGDTENICAMSARPKLRIKIFSSRAKYPFGILMMKRWLNKHGIDWAYFRERRITFARFKPAAILIIDDRCYKFEGDFPTEEQIFNFKPYCLKIK